MKLVENIINELVDTTVPISSPLLKTKVLASRIQNQELLGWVNSELDGYRDLGKVPDYRVYGCNITGDFVNGDMKFSNHPIPVAGLGEETEEFLRVIKFQQGISSLQILRDSNKSGTIETPLPAEMVGYITQNWKKMGNPFLTVLTVKRSISIGAVNEILSKVRNRLLDFMLKIECEFGAESELNDLKARKDDVTTIVHQTIINTNGHGNVINTGDNIKIENDSDVGEN